MLRFLFFTFIFLSLINFSEEVSAQSSAPPIQDILPANSMAWGNIHSMKDLKNYSAIEGVFSEMLAGGLLEPMIRKTESTPKGFSPPKGMISWGIYPVRDEETGAFNTATLVVIEMGEKAAASLQILANEFALEPIRIGGYPAFLFKSEKQEQEFAMSGFGMDPMSMIDIDFSEAILIEKNGFFFLSNDEEGVINMISLWSQRLNKEKIESETLVDKEAFLSMKSMLGGGDVEMVLMLDGVSDYMMRSPMAMYAGMMMPVFKSAFGRTDAIGVSLKMQDDSIDAKVAVHMPEGKEGLSSLMSINKSAKKVSPFYSKNTVFYQEMSCEFSGLFQTLQSIVSSIPMLPPDVQQSIASTGLWLDPILQLMEGQVSNVINIQNETKQEIWTIPCKDEKKVQEMLDSQMKLLGVPARNYLGQTVWSVDMPGLMFMDGFDSGLSLSLVNGYLMLGDEGSVHHGIKMLLERSNASDEYPSVSEIIEGPSGSQDSVWRASSNLNALLKFEEIASRRMFEREISEIELFDPETAAEMRNEMEESSRDALDSIWEQFSSYSGHAKSVENGFFGYVKFKMAK